MKPWVVLLVVIAELTSVENRATHHRSSPSAYDTTFRCREVKEGSQRYLECDGDVAASFARKHGSQLGQVVERFFFPQPIVGGFAPLPPVRPTPCPYPSTIQAAIPTPKPTVPPTGTYRPTPSTSTTALLPEATITPSHTPPTKPTQVPEIPPIQVPANGFTNYNPVVLSLNVNNNCNTRDKAQGAEEGTTPTSSTTTTETSKPTATTTEEPTKTTTTTKASKPTTSTPTSTTEEIIHTTVKPTTPHYLTQQVRNSGDEVIVKLYRQAPSTRIEPERVCSDKDLRKCLSKLAKASQKKQSRTRSGSSEEDNEDH